MTPSSDSLSRRHSLYDSPERVEKVTIEVKDLDDSILSPQPMIKPELPKAEGLDLSSCDSPLLVILHSLTDALSLPNIKQAAAFFTNDNQFLKHACTKGLKGGDFDPIFKWYNNITSNLPHLAQLLSFDHEGFTHTFKALSSGLMSNNPDVAKLTCKTLHHLLMNCRPNLPGFDYL